MTNTSLHHGHNFISPRGNVRSTVSKQPASMPANNSNIDTSKLLVEQEEEYRNIIHHL